jgi:hypothetical protein
MKDVLTCLKHVVISDLKHVGQERQGKNKQDTKCCGVTAHNDGYMNS